MSTRKEQHKAFIEKAVSDWESSGEPILSFCRSRKINPSTFYLWRKKLSSNNNGPKKEPQFIPVEVIANKLRGELKQGLILHYPNGCYVQLPQIFDAQLLVCLNKAMGM